MLPPKHTDILLSFSAGSLALLVDLNNSFL